MIFLVNISTNLNIQRAVTVREKSSCKKMEEGNNEDKKGVVVY